MKLATVLLGLVSLGPAPGQDAAVIARARELHERAAGAAEAIELESARELAAEGVAAILAAEPPLTGDEAADLLELLGEVARRCGDLDAALAAHRRVIALRELTHAPEDVALLQAQGNLAVTLQDRGDLRGAREIQEAVLATCEEHLEEDHDQLASARGNLAVTRYYLGERASGIELLRLAAASRERVHGGDDLELATMRSNLATMVAGLGDFEESLALARLVHETRARVLPPGHPGIAEAASALAAARLRLGDLTGAREVCERAVADLERVVRPDDLLLAEARGQLALVLRQQGEALRACELQRKMARVLAARLPADHPSVLTSRGNLAVMLSELGDLEGARRIEEEVLEARERLLPEGDPSLLATRANYAATLHELGRTDEARPVLERVLETYEARLGPSHSTVLELKRTLAQMLSELGDLEGARALQEHVLEAREATRAPDDRDVLLARMHLASTLTRLGRFDDALSLQAWVVEELEGRVAPDHRDLVSARHNLAMALADSGDLEGARAIQEELLAVMSPLQPDHPDRLALTANLAVTLQELGEHSTATALFARLVESSRRTLPADHPHRLEYLASHVDALLRLERVSDARAVARELADGLLVRLRGALLLAPRRARVVAGAEWGRLGVVLSVPVEGADADEHARRFVLVETLRDVAFGRSARATGADLELAQLRKRSADLRARLHDRVAGLAAGPDAPGAAGANLEDLVFERDRVERRIREHLAERGQAPEPFDLDALVGSLAPDELAVGFLDYERLRPDGAAERRLAAYALRPDAELLSLDLGPTAVVDELVEAWRATIGEPVDVARGPGVPPGEPVGDPVGAEVRAGAALRAHVLDPLLARAGEGITRLRVATDGALLLVTLDALPLGDGRVGDSLRVVSAPSLVPRGPRTATGDASLLALGGVDFGAGSGTFGPLPGTEAEVEAVEGLFEAAFDHPASLLRGAAASKSAVEAGAGGARFVHLATHGWFEENLGSSATASRDAGLWAPQGLQTEVSALAPMTLCGLALAGANDGRDSLGRVRGILTAEELSGFDLSACELAVLSACETNVGLRRAGQGIQSLQSALHAAGARTAITSLWKVDDAATRRLMELFYTKLWVEGLGTADALWQAKVDLRSEGNPLSHWAGWVLTGDQS